MLVLSDTWSSDNTRSSPLSWLEDLYMCYKITDYKPKTNTTLSMQWKLYITVREIHWLWAIAYILYSWWHENDCPCNNIYLKVITAHPYMILCLYTVRIPAVSEEIAREALIQYVSGKFCYGVKAARELVFTKITPSTAIHVSSIVIGYTI